MFRQRRKRTDRREVKDQGRWYMPLSLIKRVNDAAIVVGVSYPTHFVIQVLEEVCDNVLGKNNNPNPEAERLVEIERRIGEISQEMGDIIFGVTSSSKKEEKWLKGLRELYDSGNIKRKKYLHFKNKIKDSIDEVKELTYERDKIRNKHNKKKKKKGSMKILTRKDLERVLEKREH